MKEVTDLLLMLQTVSECLNVSESLPCSADFIGKYDGEDGST